MFKKVGYFGYIWILGLEKIPWNTIHTRVEDTKRKNEIKRNHKVEKYEIDWARI